MKNGNINDLHYFIAFSFFFFFFANYYLFIKKKLWQFMEYYHTDFPKAIDWLIDRLILSACQLLSGYFISRVYVCTFIFILLCFCLLRGLFLFFVVFWVFLFWGRWFLFVFFAVCTLSYQFLKWSIWPYRY